MIATAPAVWVPPGTFVQGDDHRYPEERPARDVTVGGFWIDVHPVTAGQFARFAAATGHTTLAERCGERSGGAVFVAPLHPVDVAAPHQWWSHAADASYLRPLGTDDLMPSDFDQPVVHVARHDAAAYAAWAGGRLPTEAEWERAASGSDALPTWPLAADGRLLANVWLGEFPWKSLRAQPPGPQPVGSYPPNSRGLFDMLGNVWEWTSDSWTSGSQPSGAIASCCAPGEETTDALGVVKGGSFLCAANYCARYRAAARLPHPVSAPTCHIGFRCVYDEAP